MRKFILFLVISSIFLNLPVISSEQDNRLSREDIFLLENPSYSEYYHSIPENPNLYYQISTYKDQNLTEPAGQISPNQKIDISAFEVNENMEPVFHLVDDTYILASQKAIFNDYYIEQKNDKRAYWLKPGFTVYSSAIGNEAKKVSSKLTAYSKVESSELVKTPRGQFVKVAEGWIKLENLSSTDNRMEKIQKMLNDKYDKEDYSIYVEQLDTGLTAGINQDKTMYSASIAKLPILYYTQQQLDQGKIQLSDSLKYVEEVNKFDGSYNTGGSGNISKSADNKGYTISQLIDATAKQSDNVASNILSYYVADQFDESYYSSIDYLTGQRWDMATRESSAKMAGQMMVALYKQNPSSQVLQSLSDTSFDANRIAKNIDAKVAHKIGDAYDYKHDVALVYSDSPFVLSILTNHSTYDNISAIADDVYAILK